MGWLFSLLIILIIEIKYKPRLETVHTDFYTSFIVFYSTRTNYGSISREFFELFKINK